MMKKGMKAMKVRKIARGDLWKYSGRRGCKAKPKAKAQTSAKAAQKTEGGGLPPQEGASTATEMMTGLCPLREKILRPALPQPPRPRPPEGPPTFLAMMVAVAAGNPHWVAEAQAVLSKKDHGGLGDRSGFRQWLYAEITLWLPKDT